jgi:hypothetical protein
LETCESFEQAVEQRRLGALTPLATRELEEHLASCTSCRNFANFVTETEETMTTADATLNETDWAAMKRALREAPRSILHQRLLHIAFALAASPLIVCALGVSPGEALPWFIVSMVPPFAIRLALDRRIGQEMASLGARDADFFARYRAFLGRRVRFIWATIVWLPVAALGIDAWGAYLVGSGTPLTVMCRGLLVVVACLVSAWIYVAWLRRYQQVRAQLP